VSRAGGRTGLVAGAVTRGRAPRRAGGAASTGGAASDSGAAPTRRPPADVVLRAVSRAFGPLYALDEVELTIPAGTFVACMGANGAGKTTLLRVIAGLATPTEGSVQVAGVDQRDAGTGLRAMIGYVGHASMLYGDLTVRENLAFHADLHGLPASAVEQAAARFDVSHALDRPARVLSRGNTQRAALARALLHDPAIVLLDEPFTGLDLASSDRLAVVLASLHERGHTVVMTVHDAAQAVLAGRLLVLADGRVVVDEPPGDPANVAALLRAADTSAARDLCHTVEVAR
jgi:heme ABC exporter ATP-binding subunit CcmA